MRGRVEQAVTWTVAVAAGAVFVAAQTPVYKFTLAADHPAIRGMAAAGDPVARIEDRLVQGTLALTRDGDGSYLGAVLTALDVPIDSQLLVFSKTSVQAAHIAPARPRAIYFNDQVMVAHVPGTPGIEAIAVDPVRGPVFYALGSRSDGRPAFTASTSCLRCHHGPNTMGVPGPFVGSVIPGPGGAPLGDDTAIITDHTTPFWERWGGWYVTARRGEPRSRANAVASSPNARDALVREVPSNVAALHHFFDPRPYLAPTSDIVALMVLEHQTQGTNLLTRVAWQARLAAAPEAATGRSLDDDLEALVDYLLFTGEAPLPAKVIGRSSFAARLRPRHAALPLSPQLPDPWPAVRGAAARGPARRIQAAEGSPRERDGVAPRSPSHAGGADGHRRDRARHGVRLAGGLVGAATSR